MDIRNSLDGLKSLLGVSGNAAAASTAKSTQGAASGAIGADSATLSSAASQVSQAASGDNVRMDKVSSIQAMLSSGTYSVSASAVAGKLIDSMLASS